MLAATAASIAGFAGCSSGATEQGTPTTTPTPLSEHECPSYDSYTGPAVCSHAVDTESASIYLLPSKTTVEASTDTVELTLYNESLTELEFNPHQWSIKTETSSGWEPVEKRISGNTKLTVSPGETHTWTVSEVVDSINQQVTLDVGTYIAEISVPNPDGSDWIRCIALFRLV